MIIKGREVSRTVKSIEIKSMVGTGGGRGGWKSVSNADGVAVWEGENILETDGRDGCPTG